jgi:hypothetical protein
LDYCIPDWTPGQAPEDQGTNYNEQDDDIVKCMDTAGHRLIGRGWHTGGRGAGTLRVINVYNNCTHNDSLEVVEKYMRTAGRRQGEKLPVRYLWMGDFN